MTPAACGEDSVCIRVYREEKGEKNNRRKMEDGRREEKGERRKEKGERTHRDVYHDPYYTMAQLQIKSP